MAVPPSDVLVLGAGIAGCALAYHLARRGVGPVTLYDPRTPAGGATGRAAGIVTEQLWNEWDIAVTRESHHEYAELARQWNPEAYLRAPFVRWTRDPDVAEALAAARERLRAWGVRVEAPTRDELARWVPAGRFDDVAGAIYSPDDACVTPSGIATMYAEGARVAGVRCSFGHAMEGLRRIENGYELSIDSGTLGASRLVVAAGAWSKRLLAALGHPLPLVPYRTQAALLRPPTPLDPGSPSVHDLDLDVYLRPEGPGRLLGGNGTERAEADPDRFATAGDSRFLAHLAESLADRFPGWADSEVLSSWAGVCTSTPDRRPYVGAVSEPDGLFVMAGFNGFGVMRAGGVARRLADLLATPGNDKAAREALAPVWPDRAREAPLDFLPRPGFTLEPGGEPRF